MVKREKNGYMWVVKEKELKKRKKKEVKQIQIHNFYFSEFMWQNENEKDLFLVEPREGGEGLCTGGGVGVEWRNGEKNEKRKCRYNLTFNNISIISIICLWDCAIYYSLM